MVGTGYCNYKNIVSFLQWESSREIKREIEWQKNTEKEIEWEREGGWAKERDREKKAKGIDREER